MNTSSSSSSSSSVAPTWSFSIQGFDDDKFKSYYKAFDYVLNRLGKEVDVLRVEIENFERYVSKWCSKLSDIGKDRIAANQLEHAIRDVFKVYLNVFDECMIVNNGHIRRTYHKKRFKSFLRDRGHERNYFGGKDKRSLNACSLDGLDYEVRECLRFDWGEKKESKLEQDTRLDSFRSDVEGMTKDCSNYMRRALDHIKSLSSAACMKIDYKSVEQHFEEKIEVNFAALEKKYGSLRMKLARKDIVPDAKIDTVFVTVPPDVPDFPAPFMVMPDAGKENNSEQDGNVEDEDEDMFALDKIKENFGYNPVAMREGHAMLREERVHHPNDVGEVYVSDSDCSDNDDNSNNNNNNNDDDDDGDFVDGSVHVLAPALSIEEKMVRHLEKQKQLREAKKKARVEANADATNRRNGNKANPYNDHAMEVDGLDEEEEKDESQDQDQDQDMDIGVTDPTSPQSKTAYNLKIALCIEPQQKEEIVEECTRIGHFTCTEGSYCMDDVSFDLNAYMTSIEFSMLSLLASKSQVFMIPANSLLESTCEKLWCSQVADDKYFPLVPKSITVCYNDENDEKCTAMDALFKNCFNASADTPNVLHTFDKGTEVPISKDMLNASTTKYKFSLNFDQKNQKQKMLFLLHLGKEYVSKLRPKTVMRFMDFIDRFNDAVLLASTEGVSECISLQLQNLSSVNFGNISYVLSRALEVLDTICKVTSLSDAFGVIVNIDISGNMLNGFNVSTLLHSCPWVNSSMILTSCGLSYAKLAYKKWNTLSLGDGTPTVLKCTTIIMRYNYILLGLCKSKLPKSTSILHLFDALLAYYATRGNKATVNSILLGILDFKALDVWFSFLEYVILSKASNIRSLDLSQCVRSVEELAAMIAGLIIVCREGTKVMGVLGRMKFIDLRSTALSLLSPSSASLVSSLDLRMRSELQVNVKDEDGEYTELEYVFD